MALTNQQQIFADEYLIDLNATRAYKAAYPNCKKDESAAAAGARLLRIVKVEKYISERMKDREKRTEITQDRVLQELSKLGFLDVRKFYDANGDPKDLTALDDDVAACIVGLDVLEEYDGYGDDRVLIGHVKKYKIADKIKALELIGRHLGMWKDKVEMSGSIEVNDPFDGLTTEELKKLINDG